MTVSGLRGFPWFDQFTDGKSCFSWYADGPLKPYTRSTPPPADLTSDDLAAFEIKMSVFHQQIYDAGKDWYLVDPIPPFSKNVALKVMTIPSGFCAIPERLEYYDHIPSIKGWGWDPLHPKICEPDGRWSHTLPLGARVNMGTAVARSVIQNHCLYYGLDFYSFLNYVREDYPDLKDIQLRIGKGTLVDKLYVQGYLNKTENDKVLAELTNPEVLRRIESQTGHIFGEIDYERMARLEERRMSYMANSKTSNEEDDSQEDFHE